MSEQSDPLNGIRGESERILEAESKLTAMNAERDALSASNQAMREALGHFASEKNWRAIYGMSCWHTTQESPELIAAAALSQTPPQALAAQQERERRLRDALDFRIGGRPIRGYMFIQFPATRGHLPLEEFYKAQEAALSPESEPK